LIHQYLFKMYTNGGNRYCMLHCIPIKNHLGTSWFMQVAQ
jgi:hypothetical protein